MKRFPTPTILVLAVFLAGCGDSKPKMVPVSGTVTYQGKPLPLGTIRFVPETGPPSLPVGINRDGTFKAETVAGQNRVAIMATPQAAGGTPDPNAEGGIAYENTSTMTRPLIPRKYSRADTSGVTVLIEPEGNTGVEIRLE